ncbi:MAG: hypothetical protein GX771_05580 [Halomonadaceae bacterium]|nr:hypothetical protein [Halomonadaceae bacterium]
MNAVSNIAVLNDGVSNACLENTQNEWQPSNAQKPIEVYGQGYFVGLVSGIMALEGCDLPSALRIVRQSRHFYDLNPNCIPLAWHPLFVFDSGRLVDLRS